MTKFRVAIFSLLLIAGAGAPWLIQRQSDLKRINSLQTQLEQLNQQRTEGQQRTEDAVSSNRLAETLNPLPDEQWRELLRLRSEVGLLRKETNDLLKLRAENLQLRSNQIAGRPQREPNLAAGDSVPVESLTFAGYATPEAAFQSTLSAVIKGDVKTLLDGFAPERRKETEKEFEGKSESEVATKMAGEAAHFANSSVRVLNSRLVSDDEAELTIYVTAENSSVTLTMKKIAAEWKILKEKH